MAHTDFERIVVEELKSIETGATEPIAYINANHYTQHNLGVETDLPGLALPSVRSRTSPKQPR